MLTEVGRDQVVNLVPARLVVRVDQVERASLPGQILIVLHWVACRVLREVVGLVETRGNMELEVKMVNRVRQTVRSIQPWRFVGKAAMALPIWNQARLRHTALRGIGFGTSATTIQRESISRMSEKRPRITPVVPENRSRRLRGNASK